MKDVLVFLLGLWAIYIFYCVIWSRFKYNRLVYVENKEPDGEGIFGPTIEGLEDSYTFPHQHPPLGGRVEILNTFHRISGFVCSLWFYSVWAGLVLFALTVLSGGLLILITYLVTSVPY